MENKYYPRLFSRGKMGSLELPNRIVRAATGTYLANPDQSVTERLVRAFETAAAGGAGLVFLDNAVVLPEYHMGVSAASDVHIPGLSQLAEAVADQGGKSGMQLSHPGRDAAFVGGEAAKTASRMQFEGWYQMGFGVPHPFTIEELHVIVGQYGDAALRAKTAGFDLVEVLACHGGLFNNFLSRCENRRDDMYGGTLHNRMRLLLEVIRDIRRKVGSDYPLGVRMSPTDYEPDSVVLEDSIALAKELENHGVDVLNISGGTHAEAIHAAGSMLVPQGYNVPMAAEIKREVGIPVIVCGAITTPQLAEEVLERGDADFIALARSLMADPQWPKKAREGRAEDITPCIRCNDGCHDKGMLLGRVDTCTVNPTLFKEDKLTPTPADVKKKVAIVGGGPAGMEAARVCALRGHDVTLYEKRALGGTLHEAAAPEFKADIRRLIDYYKGQIKKLGVNVSPEEATPAAVAAGGYDAVLLAPGAMERMLDVPGVDSAMVKSALDILGGKAEAGQRVLVVGGGATGVDTAMHLAQQGRDVTVIEMMDDILAGVGFDRPAHDAMLAELKVDVITGHRFESVSEGRGVFVDRYGKKLELPADTIVLALGSVAQPDLREAYEAATDAEVCVVGDCVRPRKIYDAIREGFRAARLI